MIHRIDRHPTISQPRCLLVLPLLYAAIFVPPGRLDAAQDSLSLWPSPDWTSATPADAGLDLGKLNEAKRYALSAGGSGMIIHRGKSVMRWGDEQRRYDIKSATKSFGATLLGIAIEDGKINLNAPARRYHSNLGVRPSSNLDTNWLDDVTILHLASQTSGFEKPGGYGKLLFRPGTHWYYSDAGPNWLAECITLAYRQDVEALMFDRVLTPVCVTRDDLRWRENQYRPRTIEGITRREFGSGISANVNALSRLGYLYLRNGRWREKQILSEEFVRIASRPVPSVVGLPEWPAETRGNASNHYGLLWWNNHDGSLAKVPHDAFWAAGLHDSLIVVIPSLDIVAVRCGESEKGWPRSKNSEHYDALKPFLEPIVAAAAEAPPYPRSDLITAVEWAPRDEIVCAAHGSDNWPITWADDGEQYTAYGDGRGFEPLLEKKLSLGLAQVKGLPTNFQGANIRSQDIEQTGDDVRGKKASGILMVDGVLYLLSRNAENSQLAWSTDHGKTWIWADWRFTTSFGCPTFLNFGKNYSGARDEFVYLYSHDHSSAYEPADRMILARVKKDQLAEQEAYEFFRGLDAEDAPSWIANIAHRGAVFSHPANCYRSGITYNAGIKRYLWCQILPHSSDPRGPRYQGGFGVYEASEPWGPWRTVFFTRNWDVGPGETSSFPAKWMSRDGKTIHLVFSGDDAFSVRKAKLR
jgi:CubicO group peptidase (beta-lactamase class C family)